MTNYFFAKHNGVLVQVDIRRVEVLEVTNNYVKVIMGDRYAEVRSSLASLLEKLPPDEFVQVHRTWAVALRHVQKIDKDLVTIGGGQIPVARRFYRELMKRIVVLGSGVAPENDDDEDTIPDQD